MRVGYRRVSTTEQNFDRQDLGAVEKMFEEKVSGKNTDRQALQEMIDFVLFNHPPKCAWIWCFDRLTFINHRRASME